MKNVKKILLLLLCAVLLVGATVAGTVAYLTSQATVTNTFTAGNVTIKLEEYQVNGQTGKKTDVVVTELKDLEMLPGRVIEKNPFVTVDSKSEECWLFVKVVNGLGEAVTINGMGDWTSVGDGYYIYKKTVSAGDKVDVFTSVTCATTLTNEQLQALNGKTIVITAYAVQSEGVDQATATATAKGM